MDTQNLNSTVVFSHFTSFIHFKTDLRSNNMIVSFSGLNRVESLGFRSIGKELILRVDNKLVSVHIYERRQDGLALVLGNLLLTAHAELSDPKCFDTIEYYIEEGWTCTLVL